MIWLDHIYGSIFGTKIWFWKIHFFLTLPEDYSLYWQLEPVFSPIKFNLWLFLSDDLDSNITYLHYCNFFHISTVNIEID